MLKPLHAKRSLVIGCLAPLLVAYAPISSAQAGGCTAKVRITSLGVRIITEDKWSLMRSVGHYHYRIDATSDEKQCVYVTFSITQRYKDSDGKPVVTTGPGSIRFRGGQGSESGEFSGRRHDSEMRVTIEDISCKRC